MGERVQAALRIIGEAVGRGEITQSRAESLIGFLVLGGEGSAYSTFYRRCAQLRALGVEPPAAPASLLAG